jgi:hypothetical protein
MQMIKTASWFTDLPAGHTRIGISRGIPRRRAAGYRIYRKLAPGSWFHSVSDDEYTRRFQTEILDRLDPHQVAAELVSLAGGGVPVMVCFERAGDGQWCHRAMVADWLAEATGQPVPEVGFEARAQSDHPLGRKFGFI